MTTVYGAVLSPFVRKVLTALEIKKIPYELKNVAPGAIPESYQKLHPLKKIPAFEDDLLTICDSTIICDYLENRYPEHHLYPADMVLRAKVLWLEEYADSEIIRVLGRPVFYKRVVIKGMMGKDIDEAEITAHLEKELPPLFSYLESQTPASGFLIGDRLSIADISVVSHFINARYSGVEVDAQHWPKLAAYIERMLMEDAFKVRMAHDERVLNKLLRK